MLLSEMSPTIKTYLNSAIAATETYIDGKITAAKAELKTETNILKALLEGDMNDAVNPAARDGVLTILDAMDITVNTLNTSLDTLTDPSNGVLVTLGTMDTKLDTIINKVNDIAADTGATAAATSFKVFA